MGYGVGAVGVWVGGDVGTVAELVGPYVGCDVGKDVGSVTIKLVGWAVGE